jgi:hypothetical protein
MYITMARFFPLPTAGSRANSETILTIEVSTGNRNRGAFARRFGLSQPFTCSPAGSLGSTHALLFALKTIRCITSVPFPSSNARSSSSLHQSAILASRDLRHARSDFSARLSARSRRCPDLSAVGAIAFIQFQLVFHITHRLASANETDCDKQLASPSATLVSDPRKCAATHSS